MGDGDHIGGGEIAMPGLTPGGPRGDDSESAVYWGSCV